MPPRPRTDSIRNPATSVPMRVGEAISTGPAIIRPSARKTQDAQASADPPYQRDGRGGPSLPARLSGSEPLSRLPTQSLRRPNTAERTLGRRRERSKRPANGG